MIVCSRVHEVESLECLEVNGVTTHTISFWMEDTLYYMELSRSREEPSWTPSNIRALDEEDGYFNVFFTDEVITDIIDSVSLYIDTLALSR